ncbi:MAG TPA: signal peptidase I [Candidatus Saccharimonadales bacterium]|nr:signal peptidase I [Candidatus Saccharimonadales bacterium]
MVVFLNKLKFLSFLSKRKYNLLFFAISSLCFSLVILSVYLNISFKFKGLVIFIASLGFLLLFLCFVYTRDLMLRIFFGSILIIASIVVILSMFVVKLHRVVGNSFIPNVLDGEYVLGNSLAYHFVEPKRGDLIIFNYQYFREEDHLGRIVGMPGDNIKIESCRVYLNNNLLDEPYLQSGICTSGGNFLGEGKTLAIPNESYFLLGDNRSHSMDSRYFGFVKFGEIKEKIFFVFKPIKSISILQNNNISTSFKNMPPVSCNTLSTKMIVGSDGRGQIGCDVEVNGEIDLSKSYCEAQTTLTRKLLIPDAYQRPNRYYSTLTGLDMKEEVKVFIYTINGLRVECLPSLNK